MLALPKEWHDDEGGDSAVQTSTLTAGDGERLNAPPPPPKEMNLVDVLGK